MNKFQFLIIIIVIVLIIKLNTKKINESFDVLEDNISKEKCGRICTKSPTCKGFAYNQNTLKCYLSKTPILGPPSFGQYFKQYDSEQMRCNKIRPISENLDALPDSPSERMKYNSIYLCSPTEKAPYKFYQIVNDEMNEINKQNIKYLPDVDYLIEDIDWTNKNKDYIKNNLVTVEKEQELLQPYTIYQKDDKEHLGQYVLPHKCVSDIPLNQCLDSCTETQSCVGVEWNNNYNNQSNVCCPKRQIIDVIDRRPEYKNGNFYIKNKSNELNKNTTYITLNK